MKLARKVGLNERLYKSDISKLEKGPKVDENMKEVR
jgi:hypothetical protein